MNNMLMYNKLLIILSILHGSIYAEATVQEDLKQQASSKNNAEASNKEEKSNLEEDKGKAETNDGTENQNVESKSDNKQQESTEQNQQQESAAAKENKSEKDEPKNVQDSNDNQPQNPIEPNQQQESAELKENKLGDNTSDNHVNSEKSNNNENSISKESVKKLISEETQLQNKSIIEKVNKIEKEVQQQEGKIRNIKQELDALGKNISALKNDFTNKMAKINSNGLMNTLTKVANTGGNILDTASKLLPESISKTLPNGTNNVLDTVSKLLPESISKALPNGTNNILDTASKLLPESISKALPAGTNNILDTASKLLPESISKALPTGTNNVLDTASKLLPESISKALPTGTNNVLDTATNLIPGESNKQVLNKIGLAQPQLTNQATNTNTIDANKVMEQKQQEIKLPKEPTDSQPTTVDTNDKSKLETQLEDMNISEQINTTGNGDREKITDISPDVLEQKAGQEVLEQKADTLVDNKENINNTQNGTNPMQGINNQSGTQQVSQNNQENGKQTNHIKTHESKQQTNEQSTNNVNNTNQIDQPSADNSTQKSMENLDQNNINPQVNNNDSQLKSNAQNINQENTTNVKDNTNGQPQADSAMQNIIGNQEGTINQQSNSSENDMQLKSNTHQKNITKLGSQNINDSTSVVDPTTNANSTTGVQNASQSTAIHQEETNHAIKQSEHSNNDATTDTQLVTSQNINTVDNSKQSDAQATVENNGKLAGNQLTEAISQQDNTLTNNNLNAVGNNNDQKKKLNNDDKCAIAIKVIDFNTGNEELVSCSDLQYNNNIYINVNPKQLEAAKTVKKLVGNEVKIASDHNIQKVDVAEPKQQEMNKNSLVTAIQPSITTENNSIMKANTVIDNNHLINKNTQIDNTSNNHISVQDANLNMLQETPNKSVINNQANDLDIANIQNIEPKNNTSEDLKNEHDSNLKKELLEKIPTNNNKPASNTTLPVQDANLNMLQETPNKSVINNQANDLDIANIQNIEPKNNTSEDLKNEHDSNLKKELLEKMPTNNNKLDTSNINPTEINDILQNIENNKDSDLVYSSSNIK